MKTDKCSNSRISGKKQKADRFLSTFILPFYDFQLKNIFFAYLKEDPETNYSTHDKSK